MNIKKFEEYKNFDVEYSGDISEEYAKLIISEFIDNQDDNTTLEHIYADIIISDELESHETIIKESIVDYLENLRSVAEKIRDVKEIESDKSYLSRKANKYNI